MRTDCLLQKIVLPFAAMCLCLLSLNAAAADIRIVSPASQETVHNNAGNITVRINAALEPEQHIRLLLDDAKAAPDTTNTTIDLQGINRGEHTLQALLLDRDDNVLASSDTVTFYMWQASVKFPSRE